MTLARLWAFLAVGLPVLGALLASLQTVDLAYHLRAGGLILDTAAIPTRDSFTFTAAGAPWQDQQWGAEVVMAGVYRLAGWTGLVVLRAALVGAMFGLVYDLCRRGHMARTATLLALAAFGLAAVTLALRPQLFGMVLFTLALWLVWRRRERPRLLWLAIPIAALWANLHGSFFLAPTVLGIAWLEDLADRVAPSVARRTLLVAVGSAVATLVNPVGPAVWSYAVGISTNATVTNRITEWQPTTVRSIEGFAFFVSLGLIAVLAIALVRRARPVSPTILLWLVPFAALGAWAVRGLAWWPFVAAVVVARLAASPPEIDPPRERSTSATMRRLNAAVATVLVVAGIGLLPAWRPDDPGLRAPVGVAGTAPPGITAALRDVATPSDRLFAPQPWGSWFEFALPATPVFIDSRIELFAAAVWDDYDAIAAGLDGWQATLERWGVTLIIAADDPDSPGSLAARLGADAGWRRIYADDDGAVFVRADRGGLTTA